MAIKFQRTNSYPPPPAESASPLELSRYVRRLHDSIVQADHARIGEQVYGINTLPVGNEVVGVNSAADRWEYKTVTAGVGMTVGHTAGVITLTNTSAGDLASHLLAYDHDNYDTAYGWGDHAGLYEPVYAAGTTAQYYRGDKTWQTLNQAAVDGLETTDSPVFVTVKLSGLTDGYIPYHVNDTTGLADSPVYTDAYNVGVGQTTFGTSATKTIAVGTGVAPSDSPADAIQLYSADYVAGNACPHFRTEGGTTIGLNQSLFTTDDVIFEKVTIGPEEDTDESLLIFKSYFDSPTNTESLTAGYITGEGTGTVAVADVPATQGTEWSLDTAEFVAASSYVGTADRRQGCIGGGLLIVNDQTAGVFDGFSVSTGALVRSSSAHGFTYVDGMASDGTYFYATGVLTSGSARVVNKYNISDFTLAAAWAPAWPLYQGPYGLSYANGYVWAYDASTENVFKVDVSDMSLSATIAIPLYGAQQISFADLDVDDAGTYIYAIGTVDGGSTFVGLKHSATDGSLVTLGTDALGSVSDGAQRICYYKEGDQERLYVVALAGSARCGKLNTSTCNLYYALDSSPAHTTATGVLADENYLYVVYYNQGIDRHLKNPPGGTASTEAGVLRFLVNDGGVITEAANIDSDLTLTVKGAIVSELADGTAPFQPTSTTVCPNLNADMVDGYDFDQSLLTTDSPTFVGLTLTKTETGGAPGPGYVTYTQNNKSYTLGPGEDASYGTYVGDSESLTVSATNTQDISSVYGKNLRMYLYGSGTVSTADGLVYSISNTTTAGSVKNVWVYGNNYGEVTSFYYGLQSNFTNWSLAGYTPGSVLVARAVRSYIQNSAQATATGNAEIGTSQIFYGNTTNASSSGTYQALITKASGFEYDLTNTGANAVITNSYGVLLGAPTNTGTITNHYGIYLADQTVSGSTLNYAMYSAGGKWYVAGELTLGALSGAVQATAGVISAGTLPVASGGTGATTLADGGLVCGNGTGAVEVVSPGLTTQILVGGGANTAPAWGADIPTAVTIGTAYIYRVGGTDVSVADGGTGASTFTDGGLLVGAGSGAIEALAVGLTTQILVGGGAGTNPAWGTDIPTGVTIGSKYVYRADGTDVPVADGGTGVSTLTDHGVLLGSGTDPITAMTALGAGEVIYGVAGADPTALAANTTATKKYLSMTSSVPSWAQVGSAEIDHDATTNFVANEHIDHTAVTLTAGDGLTGGGDISANRTFAVGAGTGIGVAADAVSLSHLGLESLADPGGDRIYFWDDGETASKWLACGDSIAITTTTLDTIQDIRTSASPTFVTAKLSGLTDGYVPYHVADATGLANSPIFTDASNVGIGQATFGTSAVKALALGTGTAPSTSPADAIQLYSADFAAGNACPYFRTENGTVVGLNQSLLTTDSVTFNDATIATEEPSFTVTAESLGDEKVTNGGFDSNTTGWTPGDCTIASVAGGDSGNCLEITRTGGTSQYVYQDISISTGVTCKLTIKVKSGTSGNESFIVRAFRGTTLVNVILSTTTASWVEHTGYFTTDTTGNWRWIIYKNSATAGTMLFDTVSIKFVSGNQYICFDEGGVELVATIAAGTYTGTTLAAAVDTALDAAGADYTVSYSTSTRKFTLAKDTGNYTLRWLTGTRRGADAADLLGFDDAANDTGAGTYTSDDAAALTIPSAVADSFQVYSADQAAGNACPHFTTENGAVVKLYKYVDNDTTNTPNSGDADTDDLISAMRDALVAFGLLAAS